MPLWVHQKKKIRFSIKLIKASLASDLRERLKRVNVILTRQNLNIAVQKQVFWQFFCCINFA
uniref:DNA-directed RNA polymerase subunit n=1 Tax=Rhizophora mucronata TaxID=61149 RepID=A0A2P2JF77_RHIMU